MKKKIDQGSGKNLLSWRLLTLSVLFLLNTAAWGQGINFTGTWTLNESKSKFGDSQFRMGATTIVALHEGNILSDERTQPGFDGGEMKTSEKISLDGKVSENTGFMDSKRKSTAEWAADKRSVKINTVSTFNMDGQVMEFNSSEVWSLLDNGKALRVESTFATPDGEISSILVYDKK